MQYSHPQIVLRPPVCMLIRHIKIKTEELGKNHHTKINKFSKFQVITLRISVGNRTYVLKTSTICKIKCKNVSYRNYLVHVSCQEKQLIIQMLAEHRLMQVNIKCIGVEPLFCCSQLISTKNHIIGSKWGKSWQKMQNTAKKG